MQYTILDKELIKIRNIKNIDQIIITNISNPSHESRNASLLGIIVNANSMFYHYIQTDHYFDEYLKHIIEQYQKEKEIRPIQVSEELIPILEGKETLEEEIEISYYLNQPSFEYQKIKYPKFKINQIKKLLFRELNNISLLTKKGEVLQEIVGYRDRFGLIYERNGNKGYYPIHIEEVDDFLWKIKIENYFDSANGLELNITFKGYKTQIKWKKDDYTLSAIHEIEFQEDSAYETAILYQNRECIYLNKEKLEEATKEEKQRIKNILSLFHVEGNFHITKLPWNDYHLTEETKETLPTTQEKKKIRNLDLIMDKKNIYLAYNQKTKIKSYETGYELVTDARKSFHHAIKYNLAEDYGIIESKFYPLLLARSKYKNQLENRYTYELFKCDEFSLEEIKEVDPKPIPYLKEKDLGYKLLEKRELRKIQSRGEQNETI